MVMFPRWASIRRFAGRPRPEPRDFVVRTAPHARPSRRGSPVAAFEPHGGWSQPGNVASRAWPHLCYVGIRGRRGAAGRNRSAPRTRRSAACWKRNSTRSSKGSAASKPISDGRTIRTGSRPPPKLRTTMCWSISTRRRAWRWPASARLSNAWTTALTRLHEMRQGDWGSPPRSDADSHHVPDVRELALVCGDTLRAQHRRRPARADRRVLVPEPSVPALADDDRRHGHRARAVARDHRPRQARLRHAARAPTRAADVDRLHGRADAGHAVVPALRRCAARRHQPVAQGGLAGGRARAHRHRDVDADHRLRQLSSPRGAWHRGPAGLLPAVRGAHLADRSHRGARGPEVGQRIEERRGDHRRRIAGQRRRRRGPVHPAAGNAAHGRRADTRRRARPVRP